MVADSILFLQRSDDTSNGRQGWDSGHVKVVKSVQWIKFIDKYIQSGFYSALCPKDE